ncbi:hypothetical protein E05_26070 [Plautia stali symbiont]|nr:hypothetical protein E05_26070 [Plautia stali symbiont]
MLHAELTAAMQQAGIRRLCVIAGEAGWARHEAATWQAALPGDWLTVSDSDDFPQRVAPAALRTLLGREFQHAIFDARHGFHAEAFAALAGTLRAGSWLLLLTPDWNAWPAQPDRDSLRWADVDQPIATPHFIHHLQQHILQDAQVMLLRQHQTPRLPAPQPFAPWQCRAPEQQAQIVSQLCAMPSGVAVIIAPRGRGKSALAGMLARQTQSALVTAPAKVSTDVLALFAAEQFSFMAPDAILAQPQEAQPLAEWLIVDEAAAIPAPLLQQLVQRFPRVLLTTTVQGYEGTGRGFMLRFCATLPQVRYFQLDEPLRWSAQDPLEQWLSAALLFAETEPCGAPAQTAIFAATPVQHANALQAGYRLLASAHYRTSPLDLRHMLDAPGMHFWLAGQPQQVTGALWLVEEGGLDAALAQAVWAGLRRPRGNLVAQSLAAHAGFTEAATLRSLRISRIAVQAAQRQRGIGRALVATARQQAQGTDYLSVSFGYTAELWQFWRACGFTLVRIGSQREASSGCYAAMAICALTPAGEALQQHAAQRLARDWPWLQKLIAVPLTLSSADHQSLNADDWPLLAAFAWAQRPYEASYPALQRLAGVASPQLLRLRAEAADALITLDAAAAQHWQQRLGTLQ